LQAIGDIPMRDPANSRTAQWSVEFNDWEANYHRQAVISP